MTDIVIIEENNRKLREKDFNRQLCGHIADTITFMLFSQTSCASNDDAFDTSAFFLFLQNDPIGRYRDLHRRA